MRSPKLPFLPDLPKKPKRFSLKAHGKCRRCLYRLGIVKCIVDPCPGCLASGKQNPPFPVPDKKK